MLWPVKIKRFTARIGQIASNFCLTPPATTG